MTLKVAPDDERQLPEDEAALEAKILELTGELVRLRRARAPACGSSMRGLTLTP